MKRVSAGAKLQIDSTSGSASVLGRELVGDDLNFLNRIERRNEPLSRRAIVVVVETLNRQVV